jgi:hypothetical protein
VSWHADFANEFRIDLIGIERVAHDEAMDLVVQWQSSGPPRENERNLGGISLFEEVVAGRYLMAYIIDESRGRFMILWLREKPGGRQ